MSIKSFAKSVKNRLTNSEYGKNVQRVTGNNDSRKEILKDILKKAPRFKKGGKVKKTGLAVVHKGEMVTPRHKVTKSMKKKMGFK